MRTNEVSEMELYLQTLLRQVDSSLEDEWERMRDPNYQPISLAAGREPLRPPAERCVVSFGSTLRLKMAG